MVKKKKTSHTTAKTCVYNGNIYPSKLEADFARALDQAGVKYERQHTFTLQPSFKDEAGACRAMTYTSDFNIGKIHVDTKGRKFTESMMRIKILRFLAHKEARRIEDCAINNVILYLAFKRSNKWVLWAWEEPRVNSKRKSLSFEEFIKMVE